MSALEGHTYPSEATTFQDAEVHKVVRELHRYGPLTRAGLFEVCGGKAWGHAAFQRAVAAAIESGEVVALTDELFAPAHDDGSAPAPA